MTKLYGPDDLSFLLLAVYQQQITPQDAMAIAQGWLQQPNRTLVDYLQDRSILTDQEIQRLQGQLRSADGQHQTLAQTLCDCSASANPEFDAVLNELHNLVGAEVHDSNARSSLHTVIRQWQASTTASRPERVGSYVGPFRLLQLLGEGGMGSVWLAEQEKPVQRRVAIKLIKGMAADRRMIARFELERQALAMMDHNNIAKVLQAGSTSQGQPYVAMEFIDGVPLNEYCDRHQLSLPDRLRIFVSICYAVQHAHQKGIIHRDLKPTNILVGVTDGQPIPKVIDFGLAKPIQWNDQAQQNPATLQGQIVGTLRYMSPEQAESGSSDIDTRTDIYSLGIILYELLTGSTPLDRQTQGTIPLREILAVICEQESPRPSSYLSSSSKAHNSQIAKQRQLTAHTLYSILCGELDWIVMKAIQKDRQLRYESAAALARDVERFLSHQPVEARPPSNLYRLKKFVGQHRTGVIAATLVLLSLLGGIIGSTASMNEARKQQTTALKRLTQIERSNQILADIFTDLNVLTDVQREAPIENRLADRLVRAGEQLDGDAIGEPQVVASLQFKLGQALFGLGRYAAALTLFEKSEKAFRQVTETPSREVIECMLSIGSTLIELRQLDSAVEKLSAARAAASDCLGPKDVLTLKIVTSLASAYAATGKHGEALPLFRENLAQLKSNFPDDSNTMTCANGLAFALQESGDLVAAIPLFEDVFDMRQTKLGKVHPETLVSANNLAFAYYQSQRQADAVKLFKSTYELSLAQLTRDNPQTLTSQANYAKVLLDSGDIKEGTALLVNSLQQQRAKYILSPDRYAALQASVASQLMQVESWAEAEAILYDCHRTRAQLQPDLWSTFNTASMLGQALMKQGKYDDAEKWLLEGYEGLAARQESMPPQVRPRIRDAINRLIEFYQSTDQPEQKQKWEALLK